MALQDASEYHWRPSGGLVAFGLFILFQSKKRAFEGICLTGAMRSEIWLAGTSNSGGLSTHVPHTGLVPTRDVSFGGCEPNSPSPPRPSVFWPYFPFFSDNENGSILPGCHDWDGNGVYGGGAVVPVTGQLEAGALSGERAKWFWDRPAT